jgi:hypothetical protein
MDSYRIEIDYRAKEVIALPVTEGGTKSEQLERLLLAAPTLSEDELQSYAQVREWMNQWTVSEF